MIVKNARSPGVALEQIHVFVLAHILRRPIIIYGVKYVKSFRGETLDLAKFEGVSLIEYGSVRVKTINWILLFCVLGVYLPLLWESSFCFKSPVALAYTRGHFSALVCMDGESRGDEEEGEEAAEAAVSSDDWCNHRGGGGGGGGGGSTHHVHWLPLVDHERTLLPIHFLSASEVEKEKAHLVIIIIIIITIFQWGHKELLLRQWLHCHRSLPSGLLIARQKRSCPNIVAELVDEWMQKYRQIDLSE